MADKPLPSPTTDSEPFWNACLRHELLLQRCTVCERYRFYPRHLCPWCGSAEAEWRPVSGRGIVYAVTIVHRAPLKAFIDDCPYVVALIELDEGPRMMSNVVGVPPEQVAIEQRVQVVFEHVTDNVALPKFRPMTN